MERKVDSRSFRDGAVKKLYSPKILANKKSSAFPGIRSAIPRSGHPGHHAGTQRGRLKELRIRCVARKFLYLWIRKTFGRVFPSKARCYYKQRVLRKVFEEWKGEWWVSQREWKLCVRADCYYRYYLYSLMFQTWRTYVHQQQDMRNKYTRAENYDAKQKIRRAWKSWLIYVVFRRTKFQMQTTALEFRQQSILWAWWSEWRRQLGQIRVGRALCASAVKHRALSLKLQAWSRWQEQLLHVQRERQKLVCAVKHHQHWQKRRCLKAWLDYLQARRVKRQQNAAAPVLERLAVSDRAEGGERAAPLTAGCLGPPQKNIATQVCQVVVTAYAEEARQAAATGQSRQALPAENPARSLPGVEETVAMAPAGERPGGQSSTLPQGDIREASICYLVAEDVSASRTPLGRENGHPSRGAAAPVQVLVHVAPAGGSTSPGAAVASSGPCPPPPGEAQDGFLHLEGERPRAQIREDGRGAGGSVPLSSAPARGLAPVEGVPDSAGRRAAEADARRPAPPAHPAAPGAAHLGGLPEPRAERPSRGGGQGEPAPEAAAAVCVTSLEGECSGLHGGSKENLSSEGSLPKGPVPQGLDPVAGGRSGADLLPGAGGLCPPGGPAGAGEGLSQDLVSALAGPGPEGSPAASPAGEGGAALLSAASAAGPGPLESAPPRLRQEEAAAEAGRPAPGPDTQPVLLPPVATPAGEQAAGAAGHSSGPVALGLLASGKGVGCVAGLRAGEEEEEGEAGAGGAGLPPAAPPGGRHLPPAVHSGHEGPPAAAACPAAGAAEPFAPQGSSHDVPTSCWSPCRARGPWGGGSLGGQGPETPRERDLGLAPPTGSSLTRPFSEKAQTVPVPSSALPQPGALPSASGLKLVPMASTGPQLLPPSSFMPCGVGPPTEASAWLTSPGLMPQAPLSLASVPDSRLLLPEALTGGHGSETAGVHLRSVSAWVPSIQPGPSWERGQDQVHCPVALGHSDLEAELESIQRQLQDYQSMKQSLRSYQRQASSLRRWLELSREEPRPEDQEAEQQVQEELQEVRSPAPLGGALAVLPLSTAILPCPQVELQAQQLAAELQARRQPVSTCIARVQALRRALC
ncbi:protein SFI1 homolog isoform X6 [Myotis lucifugus]|uniref:protein SFI1 homolog isoform X6 n=1 Tax=Myotis lucifugus TaxID=59463 RepID=UPI0006D7110C|nr:protein SFI1 homolog isoform X6 [Myotis lucifugus]